MARRRLEQGCQIWPRNRSDWTQNGPNRWLFQILLNQNVMKSDLKSPINLGPIWPTLVPNLTALRGRAVTTCEIKTARYQTFNRPRAYLNIDLRIPLFFYRKQLMCSLQNLTLSSDIIIQLMFAWITFDILRFYLPIILSFIYVKCERDFCYRF